MYNLSIHFGPNAVTWQFLFKEKEKAKATFRAISEAKEKGLMVEIMDDYGQIAMIGQISGYLLEDVELMEECRIQRALAEARASAKLNQRARSDSTILAAQRGSPVLQPMGGGFRQN